MACPDCGYMMTPFDIECPRCKHFHAKGMALVPVKTPVPTSPLLVHQQAETVDSEQVGSHADMTEGDSTEADAAASSSTDAAEEDTTVYVLTDELVVDQAEIGEADQDTNQDSGLETVPDQQVPLEPVPLPLNLKKRPKKKQRKTGLGNVALERALRLAPLPDGVLRCPVCGQAETRKVSAVYQGGSWTEQSVGQAEMIGLGVESSILLGGVTQQNTQGHSRLAQSLAPPPCPAKAAPSPAALIGGIVLFFLGTWITRTSLPYCLFLIGIPFFILGLVMAFGGIGLGLWGVGGLAFGAVRFAATQGQVPEWTATMTAWNRLFYCPRCDSVFDPPTGRASPASSMNTLLSELRNELSAEPGIITIPGP